MAPRERLRVGIVCGCKVGTTCIARASLACTCLAPWRCVLLVQSCCTTRCPRHSTNAHLTLPGTFSLEGGPTPEGDRWE